jgi:hypothetical protein
MVQYLSYNIFLLSQTIARSPKLHWRDRHSIKLKSNI